MKRLAYVYICYGVSLAILLAVSIAASWTVKNHLDVLSGGWQDSASQGDIGQFMPNRVTENWTFSSHEQRDRTLSYPLGDTFGAYMRNARQHSDDPKSLAHVVRHTFHAARKVAPDLADKMPRSLFFDVPIDQSRRDALWAAQRGAKLDPDNAFFPVMAAILLDWDDRREESYAALRDAAQAKRFDEYANDEGIARFAALTAEWGYRGEKARAAAISSILLPHWGPLREYCKDLRERTETKENVQARADMLRAMDTMVRTDPYMIGMLVAMRGAQAVVLPPPPVSKDRRLRTPEPVQNFAPYVDDFNALQQKLKTDRPFDSSALFRSIPKVRGSLPDLQNEGNELSVFFSWKETALPPIFLFALTASIAFAACVFKMRPSGDRTRLLLPYFASISLIWIFAELAACRNWSPIYEEGFFGIMGQNDTRWLATLFTIILSVLGTMQFWKATQRPAMLVAIPLCIVASLSTYPVPYLFVPPLLFLALLAMSRARWKVPYALIGLLTISAIGLLSVVYVDIILEGSKGVVGASVIAIATFVSLLLLANGSRRLLPIMPVITLLFSIGYLATVVQEVKHNEEIKVQLDGWSRDADLLRARAGIN